jgi:hypothetical protein
MAAQLPLKVVPPSPTLKVLKAGPLRAGVAATRSLSVAMAAYPSPGAGRIISSRQRMQPHLKARMVGMFRALASLAPRAFEDAAAQTARPLGHLLPLLPTFRGSVTLIAIPVIITIIKHPDHGLH